MMPEQNVLHRRALVTWLIFALLAAMISPPVAPVTAQAQSSQVFPPEQRRYFGTGFSIASGDLDNDADLDAVISSSDTGASVYLNNGQGDLSLCCEIATAFIKDMALGDLNDDGKLDLAAVEMDTGLVIAPGTGTGSFGELQRIDAPGLRAVALGDLNGDGHLDLATASPTMTPSLTIFYNDTRGGFGPAQPLGGADFTAEIALGDLNHDGRLDIVAANPTNDNAIYLGSADHGFTRRTLDHYDAYGVALGDLDSDGDLEIVFPGQVYQNDGTGDFSRGASFSSDNQAAPLTLGDLDGNGKLDLATTLGVADSIVIYHGDGQGGFQAGEQPNPSHLTMDLLLADLNGDGGLDLVATRIQSAVTIYLNNLQHTPSFDTLLSDSFYTLRAGLGDLNNDGNLDLVAGSVVVSDSLYLADGHGGFSAERPFGDDAMTLDLALGDLNNDGNLDLVAADDDTVVYQGDGQGNLNRTLILPSNPEELPLKPSVLALGLGDLNNDGNLDLIAGRSSGGALLYLGNGQGGLSFSRYLGNAEAAISGLALGDIDADGDLDLVLANSNAAATIYLGDGTGSLTAAGSVGSSSAAVPDVALGDLNGDGNLDLIATRMYVQNTIHLGDGTGIFGDGQPFGNPTLNGQIALDDLNGDGNLDLINNSSSGSTIYLGNGSGGLSGKLSLAGVTDIASGDLDGDGAPDLAAIAGGLRIYHNRLARNYELPNNQPTIRVLRPGRVGGGGVTPELLSAPVIPLSYTLSDAESDPLRAVEFSYSLDGSGAWQAALPAAGTSLSTTSSPSGTLHTFFWDTFASGFFGQSDNVVIRAVAYPAGKVAPGQAAANSQRPYVAAMSYPFRVRGTQVRVVDPEGKPLAGAQIYRRGTAMSQAEPLLGSLATPQLTDTDGYLRGRGRLALGDELTALWPITTSAAFAPNLRLFASSSQPISTGLDTYVVNKPGAQTLVVQPETVLGLVDLDIALEWDAHNDQGYKVQLNSQLQRVSELLFDWSNGQLALGQVKLYFNQQDWNDAHIRIYANNRLRPNAVQGGLTQEPISDPISPTIEYHSGQLRIGATWNRYGDPSAVDGDFRDDWARVLAHELSHFVLFLDDNYLGIDKNGRLTPVTSCAGAMSNPYVGGGYRPAADWLPACKDTLSQYLTSRADWQTITTFHPELHAPGGGFADQQGPNWLPLAVTAVTEASEGSRSNLAQLLGLSELDLRGSDGDVITAGSAIRAVIYRSGRLIDLGGPTNDRVLPRGAEQGDVLCIYDTGGVARGCEQLTATSTGLSLRPQPGWRPEIAITPVNSTTLTLRLSGVEQGLPLQAQLFPSFVATGSPPTYSLALSWDGAAYSGTVALDSYDAAAEGYLQLWVAEGDQSSRREALSDYALGGNPAPKRIRGAPRGSPAPKRIRGAPVLSHDGNTMLFAPQFDYTPGTLAMLQATTALPADLPGRSQVGRAYRLSINDTAQLGDASISFAYLGREVPTGEESGLAIYYWSGAGWQRLPTSLNPTQNLASAATPGPGIYALMSSIDIGLTGPGWNSVAYPVRGSHPVREALSAIDGAYALVYGYNPARAEPWQLYASGVPTWVNDLEQLEFGRSYWISATTTVSLSLTNGPQLAAGALPYPPATIYGSLKGEEAQALAEGAQVEAFIGAQRCGTGQIQYRDNLPVYVIKIHSVIERSGCGLPGSAITLRIDGQPTRTATPLIWNNGTVQRYDLALTSAALERYNVYLASIVMR